MEFASDLSSIPRYSTLSNHDQMFDPGASVMVGISRLMQEAVGSSSC